MISCCSTACTFDEPDDGADIARREIRLMPVSSSEHTSGRVSPNVGHAPDFDEPESIAGVERLLQRVLES